MITPEITYAMEQSYNVYEKTGFILAEPHIVTASMVFGYFFVEEIFFILFWDEYIKPLREKIKKKIKEKIKWVIR